MIESDDTRVRDGEVGLIISPNGEFRVIVNASMVAEFQLALVGLYDAMECGDSDGVVEELIERGVEKIEEEQGKSLH